MAGGGSDNEAGFIEIENEQNVDQNVKNGNGPELGSNEPRNASKCNQQLSKIMQKNYTFSLKTGFRNEKKLPHQKCLKFLNFYFGFAPHERETQTVKNLRKI